VATGLVAALTRAVCVRKHRQVVSLVTDISAGGRRPCRGLGQARSRHAATAPGEPSGASIAGWLHTPVPGSSCRFGRGPGDLLLVNDPMGQTAVQDPHQPVPQDPQRLMTPGTPRSGGWPGRCRPGQAGTGQGGARPSPPQTNNTTASSAPTSREPEKDCGALVAVLTWHDIPPAVRPPQHRPGHALPQELNSSDPSECSPAGGSAVASHQRPVQPH
jgi:hypothetical protein